MAPVDVMMCASVTAFFVTLSLSVFAEKNMHLYSVFIGKKYKKTIHVALVSLSAIQAIGVSIMARNSEWQTAPRPIIGILAVLLCLYAGYKLLERYGTARILYVPLVVQGQIRDNLVRFMPHPIYFAISGMYISLLLISGRYGYGIAAICVLVLSTFQALLLGIYHKQ